MSEEEKNKGEGNPNPTSGKKDAKGFVEIKGEKFQEDTENLGQPLLTENGDPVPYKPEGGKEVDDIDYKAELEKAEETLVKKGESLRKAGFTIRGLEEKIKGVPDREEIKDMIQSATGDVYSKVFKKEAKDVAYAISDGDSEAKLTLFHYKNSIVKTGRLEEDMRKANAIANQGQLTKKVEEMGRTLLSKKLKGGEGGVGGKKPEVKGTGRPILTPQEESLVINSNLVWDAKEGKWKGKSGKFYDHIPQGEGPAIVEGPGGK